MKKVLVALLLCIAAPSFAAVGDTLFVSNRGTDFFKEDSTQAGRTAGYPISIFAAMTYARPGAIVYIASGGYSGNFSPINGGTSAAWIRYIPTAANSYLTRGDGYLAPVTFEGNCNLSSDAGYVSHVSIRQVTFHGDFNAGQACSLSTCNFYPRISAGYPMTFGWGNQPAGIARADSNVLIGVNGTFHTWWMAPASSDPDTNIVNNNNSLRANVFRNCSFLIAPPDNQIALDADIWDFKHCVNNTFDSTYIRIVPPTTNSRMPIYWHMSQNNVFTNSRIDIDRGARSKFNESAASIWIRDAFRFNTFNTDTFYVYNGSPSAAQSYIFTYTEPASGDGTGAHPNMITAGYEAGQNGFTSCVFVNSSPGGGGLKYYRSFLSDTLKNCIVAVREGPALVNFESAPQDTTTNGGAWMGEKGGLIQNNTFYSDKPAANGTGAEEAGVFELGTWHGGVANTRWSQIGGPLTIKNNGFVVPPPSTTHPTTAETAAGAVAQRQQAHIGGIYQAEVAAIYAGRPTNLTQNYNAFWDSLGPYKSVYFTTNGQVGTLKGGYSGVGATNSVSTDSTDTWWYTRSRSKDSTSVRKSPGWDFWTLHQFIHPPATIYSYADDIQNLNLIPDAASGWVDTLKFTTGYAGYVDPRAIVADTVGPTQTDIQEVATYSFTTPISINLNFKAPMDRPNGGKATSYDIRYSLSALTDAFFDGGTPLGGLPTPGNPGANENFSFSAIGLPSNAHIWFAIKSRDAAGNLSPIGNVFDYFYTGRGGVDLGGD